MGSKKKFWYRQGGDGSDWLFKFPRPDTGEHWAEKIAAGVADLLGITHATVELARFGIDRGSISRSFTPNGFELVHGNQLLGRVFSDYNRDLTYGQADHTLENIFAVMDRIFIDDDAKERSKRLIVDYLVLDALIGNTDRHHENWGIVRQRRGDGWVGSIAPSFDHASSLGRELQDTRRCRLMAENRVGRYIAKGRGGIYQSSSDRRGPSPLALVRHAATVYPDLLSSALTRLDRIEEDAMVDTVDRVPDNWMSVSARDFVVEMMELNIEQLRMIGR